MTTGGGEQEDTGCAPSEVKVGGKQHDPEDTRAAPLVSGGQTVADQRRGRGKHISNKDTPIFTVDFGARVEVIFEKMAARYPMLPPARSQRGFVCTAANGTMANTGEEDITIRIVEGHTCMMNMHVTDGQRLLISVSR